MLRNAVVIGALVALVALVAWQWRTSAITGSPERATVAEAPDPAVSEDAGRLAQTADDTPAPPNTVGTVPADQSPQPDAMRAQLSDIAAAYRESVRYPSYSRPLGKDDWQQLNPRAFVPREMPVEGQPDLSVSVSVAQYINDIQRPLAVTVTASSPVPQVASVVVSLQRDGQRTGAAPLSGTPVQGNVQSFHGQLEAAQLQALGPGEAVVVADMTLNDGTPVTAAAQVSLYQSDADLLYLGDAYVEGPHLVIPAWFDVHNPGYFRVAANLFDAATGDPVSHINAAFVLSEEDTVGLLKVHAVTLRAMQAGGPYTLTDFSVSRSPSRPGDRSGFGTVLQESFTVAGFGLDAYSDEPYVDQQAQQRLEFLEKISGGQP